MNAAMTRARAVADAVLYEGYLLYPYRSDARKNQSRWQFGVLGPHGAAAAGFGEDDSLAAECLVRASPATRITLTARFLQLQRRTIELDGAARAELIVDGRRWVSWDEAAECEIPCGPSPLADMTMPIEVPGWQAVEPIPGSTAGVVVRTRSPIEGTLELTVAPEGEYGRVGIRLRNNGSAATSSDDATTRSMLGAHVIAELGGGEFVSLLDPEPGAETAVEHCTQHRCFPVLAGPPGDNGIVLVSPIILYDHPEIAEQSAGQLFDSTEIDEILTLRVMTMTDDEKERARATDPRAAEIIDRCDGMTPDAMHDLHGLWREPAARLVPEVPEGMSWWDPDADGAVRPESDAVPIAGVLVRKGSRVRLRPARRADAHDLFYEGRSARVTSVHADVDGETHVGVVIDDDPAADLHEWYGRYLYFAPDELEPIVNGDE
ncbi:hypothetical protein [Nocardia sp. NPDC049707]|uniref:hypothetical protein n=1 Tax=Nocardia sp. NPDC049707 TaxID=3154735 RepID=UPI0034497068